jgi:hypothetical protein
MRIVKTALVLAALGGLTACGENFGDMTADRGIDSSSLGVLQAGIWVDPNGCDHWIIDDGFEGYMDARLDRNGRPICSGIAPPNTAVGPYKAGSTIPDSI